MSEKGLRYCEDAFTQGQARTSNLLWNCKFYVYFHPQSNPKNIPHARPTEKECTLLWTTDMQQEIDFIKETIANTTQLIHYDLNRPLVIETDALIKGIVSVLLQDSKALMSAVTKYSNIERDISAVLFACERLHVEDCSVYIWA